jgi:glycosyltransferase involved in cell wall biosynthesis
LQLTIIIPFYNGNRFIDRLIKSLPPEIPILVVDDQSSAPYQFNSYSHVQSFWMEHKGYFTGAVNAGMRLTNTDVLILNQDTYLEGTEWLDMLAQESQEYAIIGERIGGEHPAWEHGYVQGTFMYIRRDVIDRVGLMNERDYPLWGSTCEYQLKACRAGFKVKPLRKVPGFHHRRKSGVGDSIKDILYQEPEKRNFFIRTPPEISIVATYYNNGRYAPELIASLMGGSTSIGDFEQQSFASFELIMVNDASTDNTDEILTSLADSWKGIRYIRREKNGGSAAANNTGIAQAYGKYISIICGDDMRAAGSLEKLYRAQLQNPHSFIYDNVLCFKDGQYKPEITIGVSDYDFEKLLYRNHIHAGITFPKKAWVEAGGYPEVMNDGREDWAMNIALSRVCYCGVRINDAGYLYRREGQNRSLKNGTGADHKRFLAKLNALFPELYRGERPMCNGCGGRRPQNVHAGKRSLKTLEIANMENLVIIEYVGKSYGTQSFYGVSTGSRYSAGLTRPRVAVDKNDLVGTQNRPGLLELHENGRNIFRLLLPPAPVSKAKVVAKPEVDVLEIEAQLETDMPVEVSEPVVKKARTTKPRKVKVG